MKHDRRERATRATHTRTQHQFYKDTLRTRHPAHNPSRKYFTQQSIVLTIQTTMNLIELREHYSINEERFKRVYKTIQHGDYIHITGGTL